MNKRIVTFAEVIAASLGRDNFEKKQIASIIAPVMEKKLYTHCECCGHALSRLESMLHGLGHLCDTNQCQCKIERKTWSRKEVMEVIYG